MLKLLPQSPPTIHLRQVGPRSTPLRRPNKELRSREYLTPTEMDAILEAARKMRHGHRDSTMLLIAYRHGFRAAEIVDLRWDQVDLDQDPMQGWPTWWYQCGFQNHHQPHRRDRWKSAW
jgi:integrase